jgi:branched-chain amino acid transport system ATP-binding protein
MLRLDGVSAGYGDTTVLWDVSLEVRRGEAVALLGRNGMGKTTTLRTIMGLTAARRGTIVFKGVSLVGRLPFQIARLGIGYAPEGRQLFGPLTVLENLRIPFVNKHPNRRQWQAQLDLAFGLFPQLAGRLTQRAGSLSGGEQQMLAIARALIGGDELLILDEPTEGLAPAVVAGIVEALKTLKQNGLSVFLVEQNVHTALTIADRAYVLEKGRVSLSATAAELTGDQRILERHLGIDVGA